MAITEFGVVWYGVLFAPALLEEPGEIGFLTVDRIRKALKGTVGCRVEVRTPDLPEARVAAKRLLRIFDSCGYVASICVDTSASRDGVHIEARSECAASALSIQSAFQHANIDATVAVHDKAPPQTVVVNIGPRGVA